MRHEHIECIGAPGFLRARQVYGNTNKGVSFSRQKQPQRETHHRLVRGFPDGTSGPYSENCLFTPAEMTESVASLSILGHSFSQSPLLDHILLYNNAARSSVRNTRADT
jgi:hypothetical protein